MRISPKDVAFSSSSYIDPTGRVFTYNDGLYRGIYPGASDFIRSLLADNDIKQMMSEGKIVSTELAPEIELEGFDLIVRHKEIKNPSYCFEWPMQMLKDAAELTLELALSVCKQNYMLQDATPYNVYFEAGKPVFIDLGSFVPAESHYLWAPYQQFCNFFLFPLYLYSLGQFTSTRRLLAGTTDGISSEETRKIIGTFGGMFLPGYLKRIVVPALFKGIYNAKGSRQKMEDLSLKLSDRVDMSKARPGFFRSLLKDIQKLSIADNSGHWTGYYAETDDHVLAEKLETISTLLNELKPASVFDAGSNTGRFSVLAAKGGASVVATDTDHNSVNQLYIHARDNKLDILPLLMDVLAPSPASGWMNIQYAPASKRLKCELAMALALMHHMVFTGGQDFGRLTQSLKAFCTRHLIIEYVDINDPMAKILPHRPGVDYEWYNEKNFKHSLSEHFSDVRMIKKLSPTRVLYLSTV